MTPQSSTCSGRCTPSRISIVATRGTQGGDWYADRQQGTYAAARLPGPIVDTYGAGDCFAAGLTFALGRGDDVDQALAFAARCGAYATTGPGVHPAPPAAVDG